jgi:anti-sigma factor RsiW
MVRGRKTNTSRMPSGRDFSGHLDDWAELAVEYVDGSLDASTTATIQAHLEDCPDCSRRLAAQKSAAALFAQTALVEAPAHLETQVLAEFARARELSPAARRLARKEARRRRALLNPAGPWLPAMAAGAAVLALVLSLTLSRDSSGTADTLTNMAATLSADATSAEALTDNTASVTTTGPAALGSGTVPISLDATSGATAASSPKVPSLQPTGAYVEGTDALVTGIARATGPAYFFFQTESGSLITAEQAGAIASQLTSATGLVLIDQDLTLGVKAFAAFVPRDDAAALVSLLRSIGNSLRLTVCLSLQPGAEVTSWATTMLKDKYSLAELSASASASRPPATSSWLYTTSTTSPSSTANGTNTPKATLLDQAGTHVLVVIFMAAQD